MDIAPDQLIDLAYKGILGRNPDPSGKELWLERLDRTGPDTLMSTLVASKEFYRCYLRRLIQEGGMDAAKAACGFLVHFQIARYLHPIRLELVADVVPPAERVLDLGGASAKPQGALLEMGYRHAKQITIVDLPLDTRMKQGPDIRDTLVHNGTEVRYEYHSLADLSRYPDESFDLIWSGQTFEHITEEEGAALFPQVRRVLRGNGVFALDTPNRTLTRLTVGDDMWIHAEHKIEYHYDDFLRRFADCGMEVIDKRGLLDMTRSLQLGYGCLEDMSSAGVNDKPASSYCFYLAYRKH